MKKFWILGGIVMAYILGEYVGEKKGRKSLAIANAIQESNARFVEEQYQIINEKIAEINQAREEIEEFYNEL